MGSAGRAPPPPPPLFRSAQPVIAALPARRGRFPSQAGRGCSAVGHQKGPLKCGGAGAERAAGPEGGVSSALMCRRQRPSWMPAAGRPPPEGACGRPCPCHSLRAGRPGAVGAQGPVTEPLGKRLLAPSSIRTRGLKREPGLPGQASEWLQDVQVSAAAAGGLRVPWGSCAGVCLALSLPCSSWDADGQPHCSAGPQDHSVPGVSAALAHGPHAGAGAAWGHHQPIDLTFASGASSLPLLEGLPGQCGECEESCPLLQEHWGQWGRLVLAKQFWRGKCCVSTEAPQAPALPHSLALLLQQG